MKAIQVKEGVTVPIIKNSVILIFDPGEAGLAAWTLEFLANELEGKMRLRCGTDDLWKVAEEVRQERNN